MRRRIARTLVTALVTDAASCAVAAPAQAGGAYITNERSADVSQYAIGAAGLLSGLTPPTVAAGNAPEDVAVTPDGKSAYVVNISDNSVSQYNIAPLTGGLSPKTPATVAAGGGPISVGVSPLVRVPTSVNQCLHGGFAQFGFKSVGQCVKFVVLTRVCGILDRHGIKAKFCPPEPPRRP